MLRLIEAETLLKELTCNFAGEPFHGNKKITIGEIRRIVDSIPTSYECEICHTKYSSKEACEKCELNHTPIKKEVLKDGSTD